MLLINCPWCGPREETEFQCGGQSHIQRPSRAHDVSDETWVTYLFMRENTRGIHRERWVHRFGCRQWFNIARDTSTHRVLAVYRMSDAPPQLPLPESAP